MLKKLLPQTLFARFILIIILPSLIGQVSIIYLFYKRHWYNVSRYNAKLLSEEIDYLYQKHNTLEATFKESSDFLNLNFQITKQNFNKIAQPKVQKELIILKRAISDKIKVENIVTEDRNNNLAVKIPLSNNYVLEITIHKKFMLNPTTYIFVLWVIALNVVLLIVSIFFLRRQINSVIELANIASRLGSGLVSAGNYRPSGAREIRLAGLAILKMKERLSRKILKRTQLLAMISHDLRTPLTRMKLQLELMEPENHDRAGLSKDVEDMEKIIYPLLDLARAEGSGISKNINLYDWFENYVSTKIPPGNIKISLLEADSATKDIEIIVNITTFQRAIDNIVSNSIKFANNIEISIEKSASNVVLIIEDDGPGIDDINKKLVFKPFYQVDMPHLEENTNVGLGLNIVQEIIIGHGGKISLHDGKNLGGLIVKIELPIYEN